jgi:gephyrin
MGTQPRLKAAVLVISTTAAKDPSADTSGQTLKTVFDEDGAGQWDVVDTKIVGDVVLDIQRSITQWTDHHDYMNLIVTTGGTGFATFDQTPEACSLLVIPAYSHLIRDTRPYLPYSTSMRLAWCMECLQLP